MLCRISVFSASSRVTCCTEVHPTIVPFSVKKQYQRDLPTRCETPIHLPILPSNLSVWLYQYKNKFAYLKFRPFWYVDGVPCQYFFMGSPILSWHALIDFCLPYYTKIPYMFWYFPLYPSTISLALDFSYHPFGSIFLMAIWLCCPTINATEMYALLWFCLWYRLFLCIILFQGVWDSNIPCHNIKNFSVLWLRYHGVIINKGLSLRGYFSTCVSYDIFLFCKYLIRIKSAWEPP